MMKLYKYQEEGVDFLRANTRCILGDQMGLGKTPQALMALEPDDYPVVVVCPASVRMVWQQEAEKWLNGVSTQAIRTGKDIVTGADITIISYSLFGTITLKRPQTLIVDEAHYCQSRSTLRTQRIAAASKGLTLWLLTGTPMWSRPRSLYPLLAMVGGWKKTYKEFAMKFCAGGYMMKPIRGRGMTRVWDDSGSSNLGELALLVQPYILRRLKSDVLKELPPKTRQIITVKHRLSKEEKEMSGFDFKSLEGGVIPAGPIATAVKETALWKMKSINQHIVDLMESVDKIIVFAWNREVMTRIQNANKRYGIVRIDGSTKMDDRTAAVHSFQNEYKTRIFLGQTVAAGTGITLTAASVVLFVQPSWTPAELEQAEDRAHRIGQKDNVLVQYLVTEGSIEQVMLRSILAKMGTAKRILAKS